MFDKAYEADQLARELCRSIDERCNYVVRKIVEIAGLHLEWWDYRVFSLDENDSGYFDFQQFANYINVQMGLTDNLISIPCRINKGLEDIDFFERFPTRYLFEDFEEEVRTGFCLYKKMEKERKALEKEEKERKNKLMTQIESKLSPEELRILKQKYKNL